MPGSCSCLNVNEQSPGAENLPAGGHVTAFGPQLAMAVLEGDMTTASSMPSALELSVCRGAGSPPVAPAISCAMVSASAPASRRGLVPGPISTLLWVEIVGQPGCPANLKVGEHLKVALLSVHRRRTKPLKYS